HGLAVGTANGTVQPAHGGEVMLLASGAGRQDEDECQKCDCPVCHFLPWLRSPGSGAGDLKPGAELSACLLRALRSSMKRGSVSCLSGVDVLAIYSRVEGQLWRAGERGASN